METDGLATTGVFRPNESARVEAWRIEWCLRLGYEMETAESLAVSDADLHVLDGLVKRGCPLAVAARIV